MIEFNMKALHRIENKTFFPWLRTQLTAVDDPELARAFSVVLDDIIDNQRLVSEIGAKVVRSLIQSYVFDISVVVNSRTMNVSRRWRRLKLFTIRVLRTLIG